MSTIFCDKNCNFGFRGSQKAELKKLTVHFCTFKSCQRLGNKISSLKTFSFRRRMHSFNILTETSLYFLLTSFTISQNNKDLENY